MKARIARQFSRAIICALVATAALSGCGMSINKAQEDANQATAAALQKRFQERPGATIAEFDYAHDVSEPGGIHAGVMCTPGTPLQPLYDEIVAAIWRSRLTPLHSIRVSVGGPNPGDPDITFTYLDDSAEWKALEAKYGPRPVS